MTNSQIKYTIIKSLYIVIANFDKNVSVYDDALDALRLALRAYSIK